MIDELRNYCKKHKFLYGSITLGIFFAIMKLFQKALYYYLSEDEAWLFWIIYFISFFLYLKFVLWFGRFKFGVD